MAVESEPISQDAFDQMLWRNELELMRPKPLIAIIEIAFFEPADLIEVLKACHARKMAPRLILGLRVNDQSSRGVLHAYERF